MLKINFLPDSDRKDRLADIQKALKEYKAIWEKDGVRIVKTIEKVSNLNFAESEINAIVYKSSLNARSVPLSLSTYYPKNRKLELLTHELCHRLLSGNPFRLDLKKGQSHNVELHKILFLILYDIWIELRGKEYADKSVEANCKYSKSGDSKKAWEWALSFSKEEREKKFKEFIKRSSR